MMLKLQSHDERFKLLQSVRKEVVIATYERTSLKGKDVLRKRNKWMEALSLYPENADILDEYLLNYDDDENDAITVPEIVRKSFKRKWGQQEIFDEIIVERLNAYGH